MTELEQLCLGAVLGLIAFLALWLAASRARGRRRVPERLNWAGPGQDGLQGFTIPVAPGRRITGDQILAQTITADVITAPPVLTRRGLRELSRLRTLGALDFNCDADFEFPPRRFGFPYDQERDRG